MDFRDEKRQRPDYNSGDNASRDGNKKEGHTRPRISRPSANGPVSSSNFDRPRYDRPRDNDQQRPYNRNYNNQDGGGYQQRPSYNRDNNAGGYNRNYNRPNSDRPYNRDYNDNRRPYNQDGEGGQQQSYNRNYNRDGNSYQSRPQYNRDGNDFQRRPYREGGDSYQRNSYGRDGGDRRPSFNRPYNNNRGGGYGSRPGGYNNPRQGSFSHGKMYEQPAVDPNEPIRLNKFLANAGICSRREADEYIQAGVVSVNGQVVQELGVKVLPTDKIMFHDQTVQTERKIYILLNKPKDFVTTVDDPKERNTVLDLVRNACRERIYPVGRLDRSTTGVLLLTNDGDLASKLTHPKYNKKKIYHVYLDKPLTKADMEQIVSGIELEDGEIHADEVHYVFDDDKQQVGIEIHSGRNRIVRRIFDHLGYRVKRLDRVFFAGLTKKNLPRGKWRFLSQSEVNMLKMGAFE